MQNALAMVLHSTTATQNNCFFSVICCQKDYWQVGGNISVRSNRSSFNMCDLLWRNREQVACDIQLVLGLSTDQQCCYLWSMITTQISRPADSQSRHAIARCTCNITEYQSKLAFHSGLVAWLYRQGMIDSKIRHKSL